MNATPHTPVFVPRRPVVCPDGLKMEVICGPVQGWLFAEFEDGAFTSKSYAVFALHLPDHGMGHRPMITWGVRWRPGKRPAEEVYKELWDQAAVKLREVARSHGKLQVM